MEASIGTMPTGVERGTHQCRARVSIDRELRERLSGVGAEGNSSLGRAGFWGIREAENTIRTQTPLNRVGGRELT